MPKMFDITNFDDVFGFDPKYSYSAEAVESIEQHRAAFEGLFVDRVLKLLGIKRRKSASTILRSLLLIHCNS
jgi:hypothetical protein